MAFATTQQMGIGSISNTNGAPQFQQNLGPGLMSGISTTGGGVFQYRPPEADLVSGRMQRMRRENDPYMEQSKQGAMELANARGQLNSDYAAGSAQRAAIESALPIAAQDSETLTKIGMMNVQNAQDRANRDAQLMMSMGNQGGAVVEDMSAQDREADRQNRLQLQREALAFEGEQNGLGRGHDYSMGLMGNEFDLYGQQRGFENQRQLGYDNYGMDLGRMGQEFGYNVSLARLGSDLGIRGDYFSNRFAGDRDQRNQRGNLYSNMILSGMQVPEFMANPEAFMGFTQSILGFNWDEIFGGGF